MPKADGAGCGNGPDEYGGWPCEPVDNGDGTATCSQCGWTGGYPSERASASAQRFVFGEDEYSRFVEVEGERYAVEPFPFWGWHPLYAWLHLWKRVEIGVWHLSRLTGICWMRPGLESQGSVSV